MTFLMTLSELDLIVLPTFRFLGCFLVKRNISYSLYQPPTDSSHTLMMMKPYAEALVLLSLTTTATSFHVVSAPISHTKSTTFSSLTMVSRDEFLQPHFTASVMDKQAEIDMDHIVECAEKGSCSVEEMLNMMQELDELNDQCSRGIGMECDIESNEARTVLMQALQSQIILQKAKEELQESIVVSHWRATATQNSNNKHEGTKRVQDNSFDHHVDYRQIAEYESH